MDKIPEPITFNPYKHHFRFLIESIENWKTSDFSDVERKILCIGENLLDFYTGNLTVEEICCQCVDLLSSEGVTDINSFLHWLKKEYRKIKLIDDSEWIIKKGLDDKRFIHIHPAKQSPFTIRIRAATLKTIVILQVKNKTIQKHLHENLQLINDLRKIYLQLSPVKSIHPQNGILKLWHFFSDEMNTKCY